MRTNYKHPYYFWVVAKEGVITRAVYRLLGAGGQI
jgi:hypothetical protein